MSANTNIEWCDSTWNPWMGCTKVSPACDHCYASVSTPARTMKIVWGAGQPRQRTSMTNWNLPVRWNAQAEAFQAEHGRRQRVFCASLGDWLDNEVPIEWFVDMLDVVRRTPNLDWLLLSKRIGNFSKRMTEALETFTYDDRPELHRFITRWLTGEQIPAHIWIGATICNQEEADRDIPKLLKVPARVRYLSMEPLLGPVDLARSTAVRSMCATCLAGQSRSCMLSQPGPFVDWVIVGGESGTDARPAHLLWFRSIVQQCQAAGVPVLTKQLGRVILDDGMSSPGQHWPAGTVRNHLPRETDLDPGFYVQVKDRKGGEMAEWPEDLRVRQFPGVAA